MADLWYLSPSNQFENKGVGDYGSEGTQMNLLLDEVVRHLDRCGVSYYRADRNMSLAARAAESDALGAKWYVAFHSNAGGNGKAWGPIAFHQEATRDLALCLTGNLLAVGQESNRAYHTADGSGLYEVRTPKARACLLEVDFHDSETGVEFLTRHRREAAMAIANAIISCDGKQWRDPGDGASSWAKPYTDQAKALGLFFGNGVGNFRWQDNLTREEAAVIMMRLKAILEQGR